jgi:hypothetical protein
MSKGNVNKERLLAQLEILNLLEQRPDEIEKVQILVKEQLAAQTKMEIGMF